MNPPSTASIDSVQLEDIEARHYRRFGDECNECARPYPCETLTLAAGIRRMIAEDVLIRFMVHELTKAHVRGEPHGCPLCVGSPEASAPS